MTVSSIVTPLLTSLSALTAPPPSAVAAAITQAPNQEAGATSLPRMQSFGLTNLRQIVMQGVNDHLSSRFSTALHNNETKEKIKGAAVATGGAIMQGVAKQMVKSGSPTVKIFGAAVAWMGKSAEDIGRNRYGNAGSTTNDTGTFNRYDPKNWEIKTSP